MAIYEQYSQASEAVETGVMDVIGGQSAIKESTRLSKLERPLLVLALAFTSVLGFPDALVASGEPAQTQPTTEARLRSASAAATEARSIAGIGSQFKANALLVRVEEDNTPFLADRLSGRDLWKVTVQDWRIELAGFKDPYKRILDMILDPSTGQMLKISTRWPKGEPPIAPEPDSASATRQMLGAGREQYHDFVAERPPITFMQAVAIVDEQDRSPRVAKQIAGQYVVWSKMGSEPKPMWIITVRGIPPFPTMGGRGHGVQEDLRNHFRYVVDPVRKKLIRGSTTPQPVKPRP